MRTLSIVVASVALLCVAARTEARRIVRPNPVEEYRQQIAALTDQLYRAKLDQIALLLDAGSKGESKLLIGSGVSADLKAASGASKEHIRRASPDGASPLTVYPASLPVSANLPGIGESELLGAVALRIEAGPAEGDDAEKKAVAKPDVYLLACGRSEGWLYEVRLVSLTVDDEGGPEFEPVLRTLAERSKTTRIAGSIPGVVVTFPKDDEVALPDHPPWRATVRMMWREHTYRFALDFAAGLAPEGTATGR